MKLMKGARLMTLEYSDEEWKKTGNLPNTILYLGPEKTLPKTYEEAFMMLWSFLRNQFREEQETGLPNLKFTLELAKEKHPNLPSMEDALDSPATWVDEAIYLTNLRYGLQMAVDHPEKLVELPEDMHPDLYQIILETMED